VSDVDLARLRRGELIAGGAAIVLLALMFLTPWYGLTSTFARTAETLGVPTSANAWHSLAYVRWLMLLTIVAALLLVYFQAACKAPALPVSLSLIVTALSVLTALALIYRVLINVPGPDHLLEQKLCAYLGLLSALAIVYGGYASLRTEGVAPDDEPREMETVRLARS
jgi:hypothetical protein